MSNINKKGFVLVETLIVTVFVVTLFLLVYRVTVPSIGEYEQLDKYDDVDTIYYANLMKKVLLRYGDFPKINQLLNDPNGKKYVDISDCNASDSVYLNKEYCETMQNMIFQKNVNYKSQEFKILLTKYDLTEFKEYVSNHESDFDSGSLTNFIYYLDTVGNEESFYYKIKDSNLIGKYRLFLIRNIVYDDIQLQNGSGEKIQGSKSRRYTNIGIYSGGYDKYVAGEKVKFDPGDGEKEFYVLNTSLSTDPTVDLILANNLENSSCLFNVNGKTKYKPSLALAKLDELTQGWTNVSYLANHTYEAPYGCSGSTCYYKVDFSGYRARLLEEKDIQNQLGCGIGQADCFEPNSGFNFMFANLPNAEAENNTITKILAGNLGDNDAYWTMMSVKDDAYAWTITKTGIQTELANQTAYLRPVITLYKDKDTIVKVGE